MNFRSVVHALSDALDLVGINDVQHGKRVGIIANEVARVLGWSAAERNDAFDACLLHDIGVSSSDLHQQLVDEFDWEGSQGHAEFGAYLISEFPPLSHLAESIRLHHTHWSELKDRYGPGERLGNLIFLADRADVLAAVAMADKELLEQVPAMRDKIAGQAGEMFDPELVAAFLEASRREAFWLGLETGPVLAYMEGLDRDTLQTDIDDGMLLGIARLFSHVVDAKSRFTVEHSEGVAHIARYLCGILKEQCHLEDDDCSKLELAGYLHDLGKLRIPDAILEKPGPLDERERRQIASHAYETYRILSRIRGFEQIARWASFHHEVPDGEGYPFHLVGDEVPVQARILRAADIFQALAQERPYREALPAQVVLRHLDGLCRAGKLDRYLFDAIAGHLDEVYSLAHQHR